MDSDRGGDAVVGLVILSVDSGGACGHDTGDGAAQVEGLVHESHAGGIEKHALGSKFQGDTRMAHADLFCRK